MVNCAQQPSGSGAVVRGSLVVDLSRAATTRMSTDVDFLMYGRVYLRPKCPKSACSVKLPPPHLRARVLQAHELNEYLVSLALAVDFHPVLRHVALAYLAVYIPRRPRRVRIASRRSHLGGRLRRSRLSRRRRIGLIPREVGHLPGFAFTPRRRRRVRRWLSSSFLLRVVVVVVVPPGPRE